MADTVSNSLAAPAQKVSPQPGISVVIPCYNYARFLPFAVDSCLAQDYPLFEVIVVDDGSKDNSREVCANYGDKIRYVFQENAGLPSARNTGIRNARHPFIAFLDADDVFKPGFFAAVMAKYATLPAEFALVVPNHEYVDAGGAFMDNRRYDLEWDREITARDIIMRSRFQPSGVICRREVFDACGLFDPPLRSSEDRDMWIRVAAKYRTWRMGDVLVQIRKHGSNMSNNAGRMKENMLLVLRKSRRNNIVPAGDVFFWLRAFSFLYNQTALLYGGGGRLWPAYRDMFISILLWPWHPNPARLNMTSLFRARSLARWARDAIRPKPVQG